jgi:Rieske Fe-S protein
MDRLEFLKLCGLGCLGATMLPAMLTGCAGSTSVVNARMTATGLEIPLQAFELNEGGEGAYRNYIIAQNERLQFPVYVVRLSATEYTALLMRCTHKGSELQVAGERIVCPTHGSEFASTGRVTNGPADTRLRTFPVTINRSSLTIQLT